MSLFDFPESKHETAPPTLHLPRLAAENHPAPQYALDHQEMLTRIHLPPSFPPPSIMDREAMGLCWLLNSANTQKLAGGNGWMSVQSSANGAEVICWFLRCAMRCVSFGSQLITYLCPVAPCSPASPPPQDTSFCHPAIIPLFWVCYPVFIHGS